MSLDIGVAFREGLDRTFARNGLLLAAAFAVVAFLLAVFQQTIYVGAMEATLEWVQGLSPEELGVDQGEYEQMVADVEEAAASAEALSPLALAVPLGVAVAGLVAVALVGEALSIVAVRVFATGADEAPDRETVAGGLLLATLNGFVGMVVVWGLIVVFLGVAATLASVAAQSGQVVLLPIALLLSLPALFFAVAFYFLRQAVALEDENFVQAMADSWRLTAGRRIEVFALGAAVVAVSLVGPLASAAVELVSVLAAQGVAAVLGGLLGVFGAAVVTRAYVQLEEAPPAGGPDEEADPYDAALGPDDIPE